MLLASIDGADPSDLVSDVALEVRRIDPLAVLESQYRLLTTALAMSGGHDHGGGPTLPDPEELTSLPGGEPLTALLEVVRCADSGEWDEVIVDCPGPLSWREIVATPGAVAGYVERIWPRHARVVASTGQDVRAAVLVELVDRVVAAATSVTAVLEDDRRTSAVVVARPSARSFATARELLAVTSFHGVRVDRVVAAGVIPDLGAGAPSSVLGTHPGVFWMDRAHAEHRAALEEFRGAVGDLRVDVVSAQPTEPVGSTALGAVAADLNGQPAAGHGGAALAALSPRVRHESGHGLDSVYVMDVPLPFVDTDSVAVGRVEDDVIVSAQGSRRRLRLASVLRRCVVTGAGVDDGVLSVTFAPDPALWPENLQKADAPGESGDG
ncbi:ArsA family ATPase [Rhodococcus sp. BP-359]|nr:ArsA family ATPase [Rhodococcus sp. BP-369]MBY6564488.1 ArsA family ATPase [Rhodococcus sp. BP-370]MBY6596755.1 ArsA family ATPase [Rhodococcus sp. BP-359]MBY6601094.1 ArsA family ATPase [Rhodococcus sp. BP-353]MBY6609768.1 ArsA family ATPase [Rhodococcus sp. BP-361]MBY6622781.1 ArsA family ATPase [Rhodococcus sp. BP-357]MBY6635793.1 ArsA family ATPase [Rhodococcus sp. BP-343]MBY6640131.1 ArsA family ATPase [Rhodococcus sp. BP-344]MBY6653143.1 ArsA family ATPase [Rhodococcus sp. BP-339]